MKAKDELKKLRKKYELNEKRLWNERINNFITDWSMPIRHEKTARKEEYFISDWNNR